MPLITLEEVQVKESVTWNGDGNLRFETRSRSPHACVVQELGIGDDKAFLVGGSGREDVTLRVFISVFILYGSGEGGMVCAEHKEYRLWKQRRQTVQENFSKGWKDVTEGKKFVVVRGRVRLHRYNH